MRWRNRFGGDVPDRGDELIVSITSYTPRLPYCYQAIESILRGSLLPDRIYLWLAAEELAVVDLPRPLRRLRRRGLQIEFVEPDFGPANKLVHAWARHPESRIVVADDDIRYPHLWLEQLVAAADEDPAAIVAHRCRRLRLIDDQELAPYAESLDPDGGVGPSSDLMGLGVGGVLYPPDSLHPVASDFELFSTLSKSNDDIWFKAASLLNGTETRRVGYHDADAWPPLRHSQRVSLYSHNRTGVNDDALRAVFSHFGLHDRLRAPHT